MNICPQTAETYFDCFRYNVNGAGASLWAYSLFWVAWVTVWLATSLYRTAKRDEWEA